MPNPLGDRIRILRKEKDLTLEGLAALVDSSKSYIWELENKNVARPSAEKLQQIAKALGTTAEYLLTPEQVTAEDAADQDFYRRYKQMDAPAKAKLQKMLKILDEDE